MLAVGERVIGAEAAQSLARVSCGFAGGVAGTREHLCGAISGGVMLLSQLYGRDEPGQSEDLLRERIKGFIQRFQQEAGGHVCNYLRDNGPYGDAGPLNCRFLMGQAASMLWEFIDLDSEPDS